MKKSISDGKHLNSVNAVSLHQGIMAAQFIN
jgi:hypothetical protein